MNVEIINPISYRHWNDLLMATEDYSVFHTANWARTLHESYGFTPRYFSMVEGGKLVALVPVMEVRSCLTGRRGVSLPFSDYCEPILPPDRDPGELTRHIANHGRSAGWRYIEFRSQRGQSDVTPCYRQYYTHTIDLSPGADRLYRRLRDSTRRNVEKALRQGVTVACDTSRQFVQEFYRLNCLTRRQHGLPPQPYRFFEKLHEHLIARGMGKVMLASYGGACIAGAIILLCGDRALYKYGASAPNAQHLRANNLVMWESIRSCCSAGYRLFSFGRTEPENLGLRQFKNGWGGEEQIARYYRYDLRSERFITSGIQGTQRYGAMVAKLPLTLLKTVGKYLYRHMG